MLLKVDKNNIIIDDVSTTSTISKAVFHTNSAAIGFIKNV